MRALTLGLFIMLAPSCAAAQPVPNEAPPGPCPPEANCREGYQCACDEGGRIVADSYDEDDDGAPDARYAYRYDEGGQLVLVEGDILADGSVDWREEHTYNPDGSRLSTSRDNDADGAVDVVWVYASSCVAPFTECEVEAIQEPGNALGTEGVSACYALLADWENTIGRNGLREFAVPTDTLASVLANPQCWSDSLVVGTPPYPTGTAWVLRVDYPFRTERVVGRLGLDQADLVVSIDGAFITQDTAPEALFERVAEPGPHDVVFFRYGRERSVTWVVGSP